jgi:hypothetical protein
VLQITTGFSGAGTTVTVAEAGALSHLPTVHFAVKAVVALTTASMLVPVAPVFQVMVPPSQPAAVNFTVLPAQTLADGLTVIVGGVETLPTVTVA